MKRVMTYGTFDLLHVGHVNFLNRAKALGDQLVVGLSTDRFNREKKGRDPVYPYEHRRTILYALRPVDAVVPEDSWEQKAEDMKKYGISVFAIGDDWAGKFDFLRDLGVEVVYLPRTPDVSTTDTRKKISEGGQGLGA